MEEIDCPGLLDDCPGLLVCLKNQTQLRCRLTEALRSQAIKLSREKREAPVP
jgi:hypothetical protein